MASPKAHAVPTAAIAVAAVVIYGAPESVFSFKSLILLAIWFLGQLMDYFDHLSPERVRRLLSGDPRPVEGHVDWMHTPEAAYWVFALSFLFCAKTWSMFPVFALASYVIHIVMDAGNRFHAENTKKAPLPAHLHRFYPERFKYSSGSLKL